MTEEPAAADRVDDVSRLGLRADCASCFGLCCVVPAFAVSADFAIDKPAGQPCPHLQADFGCAVHGGLRPLGFPGCAVYDCFGAGQQVSQITFGGRDWRDDASTRREMFAAFPVMRQLHELLWLLAEALTMPAAAALEDELREAMQAIEPLTHLGADRLLSLDLPALRAEANVLLRRVSELVRGQVGDGSEPQGAGADLAGADLAGADLAGASLRGAHLTGADLREADLTGADVTGADFRGADVRGADLTGTLFLTQSQLDSARGNRDTGVPAMRTRPQHWPR